MIRAIKSPNFFKWDIPIFIIGVTSGPLWQYFGYKMGYSYSHPIPFLSFAVLLDLCLRFAFIPVLIALAIKGFSFRRKHYGMVLVHTLMVVIVICVTVLVRPLHPKVPFVKGFLSRIQENVSSQQLQSYCIAVLDEQAFGHHYEDIIDLNGNSIRAPKLLQKIWVHPPNYVLVKSAESTVTEHFLMIWRGWAGDFGVAVGRNNFTLPERPYREQIQWEPGVYVWWDSEM